MASVLLCGCYGVLLLFRGVAIQIAKSFMRLPGVAVWLVRRLGHFKSTAILLLGRGSDVGWLSGYCYSVAKVKYANFIV